MSIATTVLRQLSTEGGTQPRLTWYGADDERVELSGRVLANWVTKAANLLTEEADISPGSRVLLDMPIHWRATVWALATWTAGGEVVLAGTIDDEADDEVDPFDPYEPEEDLADDELEDDDEEDESFVADITEDEIDVVVSAGAMDAPSAGLILAVALPALAMRVDEAIPAGAMDASAALMTYGDDLGPVAEPRPEDRALSGPDVVGLGTSTDVTYADLAAWSVRQMPAAHRDEAGARILCRPGSLDQLLGHALAAWQTGGSVVLVAEDVPHASLEEIAAAERAVIRC
ncbi:TIGR03089 family protein [Georgenia wangjunii]|uniref:TIGR03089 family protein n=1 Tax=Georgenia wangjunii TaxID=3117730 RepID=UPI002F26DE7C